MNGQTLGLLKDRLIARVRGRGAAHPPDCAAPRPAEGKAGQLRILVVGLGRMGLKHAEILAQAGYRVKGVCDTAPERLGLAKRLNPRPRAYQAVDRIPEGGFDLAIVATLANSHVPLVQALIEKGCDRILCEKPAANTVQDLRTLAALGAARRSCILINHPRRWAPDYDRLRARIATGEMGALRTAHAVIKPNGLANIGTHYIDLVLMLTGSRITTVNADLTEADVLKRYDGATDFHGRAAFGLSCGARFDLECTPEGFGTAGTRIELSFEHGEITVNEPSGHWSLTRPGHGGAESGDFDIPVTGPDAKLRSRALFLHWAICDLVAERAGDNLRQACEAAESIIAAQIAHREGRSVSLPLSDGTATPFPFS